MSRSVLTLILIILALVVVVILVTFVSLVAGGPNLMLNGSFESGNFDATSDEPFISGLCNCKDLCGTSAALDNWQVFRGGVRNQDCQSTHDAVAWSQGDAAADGTRLLDLTGFNGRPPAQFGFIRQDVEQMQPGSLYELSLAIGSSSRFPPPSPNPFYSVTVEAAGLPDGKKSWYATTPTTEVSHWDQHRIRFRAVTPATTFTFSGFGSAAPTGHGGDYLGFDNVSLRKVCSVASAILFGCS